MGEGEGTAVVEVLGDAGVGHEVAGDLLMLCLGVKGVFVLCAFSRADPDGATSIATPDVASSDGAFSTGASSDRAALSRTGSTLAFIPGLCDTLGDSDSSSESDNLRHRMLIW